MGLERGGGSVFFTSSGISLLPPSPPFEGSIDVRLYEDLVRTGTSSRVMLMRAGSLVVGRYEGEPVAAIPSYPVHRQRVHVLISLRVLFV